MKSVEPFGEIITFYSYKGGTGRSMALSNVACLLAKNLTSDRGVLIIDWDLEAPGLHRFFEGRIKNKRSDKEKFEEKPGLIDLFYELDAKICEINRDEQDSEILFKKIDIDRFIVRTKIPSLYLMKAGKFNGEYSSRVSCFDWQNLYKKAPLIYKSFAEYLSHHYQYVLIDSRTGVTDISGITTTLLPDKLVVVFTPNRQSLAGVLNIVSEAINYRKESIDLRPLVVFPLPSRIEASEPDLRKKWRYGDINSNLSGYQHEFENLFKVAYALDECNLENYFDEVQIQHVPRYSYGEEIAVLNEPSKDRLSLTKSYESFAKMVLYSNAPWERAEDQESLNELYHLATTAKDKGDYVRARNYFEKILEMEQKQGNKSNVASTLNTLGSIAFDKEDFVRARDYYKKSLEVSESLGDKSGISLILDNLGILAQDEGNFQTAIELFERSLKIKKDLSDKAGISRSLNMLARTAYLKGEIRQTIKFYEQALEISRVIGDKREESATLNSLGSAYANLGEIHKAIEFDEQALLISRKIGDKPGEGFILGNLGRAYSALGELNKAIKFAEQALIIFQEIGDRRGESGTLGNLALDYANLGETSKAIEFYEQALKLLREIGDMRGESGILNNLGNAYLDLGKAQEAMEYYKRALKISQNVGDRLAEGNVFLNMSRVMEKLGKHEQSIKYAEWALIIFERIGSPYAEKLQRQLAEWKGQFAGS